MKVLNFGSLNLDYVYQVEHFVAPGETLSAVSQQINCGGKGLNQSIALARAGAKVYHAGCLGRGGEALKEMLVINGVDTAYLKAVDEIQGNAVIQVNTTAENCILLFGGSNQCVTKEQIAETIQNFEAGDCLVLQNEVNRLQEMVEQAYNRGMKVVLNPSPYDGRLASVDFSKLSWLIVNEVEAEQISGSKNPDESWKILHERYPALSVVITLGSEGSVCFTGDEKIHQPAYRVKAVDTTAAGDTFAGYFIAGIMDGLSVKQCMERATAASAISVTRAGAAPSIPKRSEVEQYQSDRNRLDNIK